MERTTYEPRTHIAHALIATLALLLTIASSGMAQDTYLQFNGLSQRVDVSDNATLDLTGAFTIEAMVFVEQVTNPGAVRVVSKQGTNTGYELRILNVGTPSLEFILNQQVISFAAFSTHLNKWTHVAATWDGSAWARLYIDGANVDTRSFAGPLAANDMPFVMGLSANHSSSQGGYIAIDEVRVWSAQVSGPTLNTWKSVSLNNTHPNWASLQGYWELNEGSGQSVASVVNNPGNQGQLGSSSGVDGFDPAWRGNETPDFSNLQNVNTAGLFPFPGTAITGDFTSVTNGGNVTASFFGSTPLNVSGVTEPSYEGYSWVIEGPDGFSFGTDTEIRFTVADIPGGGPTEPQNVVVYKRDTPNLGTFSPVTTTWDSGNGQVVASGFTSLSEFIFAVGAGSLPVELASFDVVAAGQSATLRWETLSETDNAGFEIQLLGREGEFERVDFVPGHGTTGEPQTYSYHIERLEPGTKSFRLKQVDYDGAFEYSDVVEAVVEIPGAYILEPAYPNPFNPSTTIRFGVARDQHVEVSLYDHLGRRVRGLFAGRVAANDVRTLRIEAGDLPSGGYTVGLTGESFKTFERVTLVK